MKGLETDVFELIGEFSNLVLMLYWGKRIGLSRWRIQRILAARAVHVKQCLGLIVIGCERIVFEWPRRRDATGMDDFLEVAHAQPEQRRPIYLAVTANPIMQRGGKAFAPGVGP